MDKTVAILKDSISGILSGIAINNEVTNVDQAIERGLRIMAINIDVPEASLVENITLYSGVTYYPAPDKIFGSAITDFRPQGAQQNLGNYVYKKGLAVFNRTVCYIPNGYVLDFEYNKGENIMGVKQGKTLPRVIIDTMSDDDGWVAAGTASNLIVDQSVYYNSPASLRFLLTGAGVGTLTKTLRNSLSIAAYEGVGVAFLAIRIPDGATAADLTSIDLKLGSSSIAYAEVSESEGFLGAWVAGDFLLVAFDFSAAISTGSPDWSAIDYVQISLAHSSTFTNFRVGGLWISLPSPHKLYYQTGAIFLPENGSDPEPTISADTDRILLNDSAYTIFEHEAAAAIVLQSGAGITSAQYQTLQGILHGTAKDVGLYARYEADNPSQEIRTTDNYYLD